MNNVSKDKANNVGSPEEGCIWAGSWISALVIGVLSLLGYFTGLISLTALGALLGAAVMIWLIGKLLTRRAHTRFVRMSEERQELRNERARQALLRLMTNQELLRPLIVFLRPFKATRDYRVNLGSLGVFAGSSSLSDSREFETSLAKLVAPFGDFVALGQELDARGAGRVRTGDDEWKSVVQEICEAATAIIMFPSATPGTSWEGVLLTERGYIAKTVFLMPPQVWMELKGPIRRLVGTEEELQEEPGLRVTADGTLQGLNENAPLDWDAARSGFAQFGISLPEFEDYGLAFILNEDSEPVPICPLTARLSEWRKYVDKKAQRELRIRIQRIGRSFDTDWQPVWMAIDAPASQHLLPLLSYLAHLLEQMPSKRSGANPETQVQCERGSWLITVQMG